MRLRLLPVLFAGILSGPAWAQTEAPQSIQDNPQQGATPRPPEPITPVDLPPAPIAEPLAGPELEPLSRVPVETLGPPPDIRYREEVTLETDDRALPAPESAPFELDRSNDPILALANPGTSPGEFRAAIQNAVVQHPFIDEAAAERDEAEAIRNEARTGEYPVVDLSVTHFRVIDRAFSNDPQNVLERSRPRDRTDVLARLDLPIIDFGRTQARIASGNERIAAADASIDASASRIAESAIAAWYQVFTYRALVRLSEAFLENQNELRDALLVRIEQGASARADLAQYDSYRASAASQLADFVRQLEAAEAQYRAFVGQEPPVPLSRAPSVEGIALTRDEAIAAVVNLPEVERARRLARVSEFEADATRANELPRVNVGIDAGRYGVIETARDYDVRANVTLTHRFFGGAQQRTDQAEARERRADATYRRVLTEAERDAAIAWADVQALVNATEALRENYFASRQSRDALFQRFRYSRGTLNEVLNAQTNYFNVAARFVASVSELDIARYTLLADTGLLLDYVQVIVPEEPFP